MGNIQRTETGEYKLALHSLDPKIARIQRGLYRQQGWRLIWSREAIGDSIALYRRERATEFNPDWVSAPGETVADILAERGHDITNLAEQLDLRLSQARALLQGDLVIDKPLAERMARYLGSTSAFWTKREQQYREGLARFAREEQQPETD